MWVIADMGQLFLYAPELFWAFDSDLFILTADSRAAFAGERVDGGKG